MLITVVCTEDSKDTSKSVGSLARPDNFRNEENVWSQPVVPRQISARMPAELISGYETIIAV